jgi:hypothetical protein
MKITTDPYFNTYLSLSQTALKDPLAGRALSEPLLLPYFTNKMGCQGDGVVDNICVNVTGNKKNALISWITPVSEYETNYSLKY